MNQREALERLISDAVTLAAKTSAGINAEFDGQFVIDWRHGLSDFVAALDSLALVIPRSDIQGYEYAHQYSSPVGGVWTYPADSREHVLGKVAHRRNGDPRPEVTYTALERPILPWSVIPLPEEQP